MAIYDFPLFLVLRPEFQSPNLKRRLPRLLIPYTLIFLSPPGERIEVRGTDPLTFFHPHPDPLQLEEGEHPPSPLPSPLKGEGDYGSGLLEARLAMTFFLYLHCAHFLHFPHFFICR